MMEFWGLIKNREIESTANEQSCVQDPSPFSFQAKRKFAILTVFKGNDRARLYISGYIGL